MSIVLKKQVAALEDQCSIEEAETLLEWFIDKPKGKVNCKKLTHLHSAILQVLMAKQPAVSAWPDDENIKRILMSVLGK